MLRLRRNRIVEQYKDAADRIATMVYAWMRPEPGGNYDRLWRKRLWRCFFKWFFAAVTTRGRGWRLEFAAFSVKSMADDCKAP
jgi:hypothetical protein